MENNESMMESTDIEMAEELNDEKFEQLARACIKFGFKYTKLNTQEERDSLVKETRDGFYDVVFEGMAEELNDEDDKHDASVLIEEMLTMIGRSMTRFSENGRNLLKMYLNEEIED